MLSRKQGYCLVLQSLGYLHATSVGGQTGFGCAGCRDNTLVNGEIALLLPNNVQKTHVSGEVAS